MSHRDLVAKSCAIGALSIFLTWSCAGTSTSGPGGAGGEGPGGTTSDTSTATTGSNITPCDDTFVLAVDHLYLGDTNPDGTFNSSGWKQFGFNLDLKDSTSSSTDLCQPSSGGSKSSAYPDGDAGIDNSFGRNLLPIFLGLAPDMSDQVSSSISEGGWSVLLRIDGALPGVDADPVLAWAYQAAPLGSLPSWAGDDCWPVASGSLVDPANIGSASAFFPEGVITDGAFFGRTTGRLGLTLSFGGMALVLPIDRAIVAFDFEAGSGAALNGRIGGVMDTELFVAEMKKMVGAFDEGLCTGSTFDSLANQLRQASDILKDGSQDPGKTCDAISIGLGFTAKRAKLGAAVTEAPPVDPCTP